MITPDMKNIAIMLNEQKHEPVFENSKPNNDCVVKTT